MSLKNCCTPADATSNAKVSVNVDVPKIVKYLSVASVLIVGIIFGTRCFRNMLEENFFDKKEN